VWTECVSEKTAGTRAPLARAGSAAALALLCVLGALSLRSGGIFTPLRQETTVLTLTGVVNAAPRGAPLAGAAVASDRELCITDALGFFRLRAAEGAPLLVRAPGYEPLRLAAANERPLIVLLFPEAPALDKAAGSFDN